MTQEEFDTLKERVRIAIELFDRRNGLQASVTAVTKCYLTVHNGDDPRAGGIRIKEQDAVRTIVLTQLNSELAEVVQKIAEF
jgi:hypothetical protein